MSRSIRYWLLAAALLAGAFAFACNGDGDGDDGGGNGQPSPTDAVDGSNSDVDGDGDGTGDGSADVSDELRDLAAQFGITEVKVEYLFSSSGAGAEDFEGTMTLYSKPPDSWRMDIGSPEGDISMINSGGTSYMCISEDGEGQCFESPVGEALPVPFLSIFTDPGELDDLIDTSLGDVDVDESSREIAGQDATCFSISGEIEGETGEGEYCFRDDGVLLLLRASSAESGDFGLEALSVESSVSDSDFEPPYEILDIGNIVP